MPGPAFQCRQPPAFLSTHFFQQRKKRVGPKETPPAGGDEGDTFLAPARKVSKRIYSTHFFHQRKKRVEPKETPPTGGTRAFLFLLLQEKEPKEQTKGGTAHHAVPPCGIPPLKFQSSAPGPMAEYWKALQQPTTGFRPSISRIVVRNSPLRFSNIQGVTLGKSALESNQIPSPARPQPTETYRGVSREARPW